MPTKSTKSIVTMDDLLTEDSVSVLEAGETVEAKVISATKNEVWLDLGSFGLGFVGKREMNPGAKINADETITASVIDPESDYGFALLSLKKVAKEKGWDLLDQQFRDGEIITVKPFDANRGGLLVELEGIRGFLPVSQLSAKHYPRVNNADKDEILQRLNELVGMPLEVRILDLNRDENKLILSEKEAHKETTRKKLAKLKVGEIVEGQVTGTVDFGIFVNVDGVEGLIHISEISWDRVSNPADYVTVGEQVKAKIIAIDGEKLSLSMKQLDEDPWKREIKQFKAGDSVEGTITRITPFGAFIQITPAIEALVHVSELAKDKDEQATPEDIFTVGDKHRFTILDIDNDSRKISLSMKQAPAAKTAKKTTAKTAKKPTKAAEEKAAPKKAKKSQDEEE